MTMRIPELSPFFREWLQQNPNIWLPEEDETTQRASAPALVGSDVGVSLGGAVADTSYDAFKAAYRKAFGRDITQAEMNDNGTITTGKAGKPVYTGLYALSNDLIRLLPLGRLVGFDAKRLALMSGRDLLPLFQKYPNALFDFGTDYLSKNFRSDEIQGFIDSMKKLQPTHPSIAELETALKGIAPGTTKPGGGDVGGGGGGTTTPVSKWRIPSLVAPTAKGTSPLELYLSMIGAKQPSATGAGKARIMVDPGDTAGGGGAVGGGGGGGTTGPSQGDTEWRDMPNGDKQQYEWTVDEAHPTGYWRATSNIARMPNATTGGKSQAEIDAEVARNNAATAAALAGIEQAKKNYELAKSQNDREAQYQALNYQAQQQNALEQAKNRQAELELQRQQLATQERLGLGELGLKTQAQLGYADLGKDIPTLERELGVSQANLANFQAQAQAAYQAGNIALAQQAQDQAAKEYDRSQTLTEEIQKGQLGLQTAGITGAYGGAPTLEAEIRRGQLGLQAADVLGAYAGIPTLEAEIQRGQLGLQAGALTGQYGGMPTLEAQAQAQQFGLAQAGVTGAYGGAPTLQSLRQQADIAYQAAQVAFAQGNFEEGRRQFNESLNLQRQAQEFSQGIQTGTLTGVYGGMPTLAGQAQAFEQAARTAQMEREVMASPIGLIEQIYRARGQAEGPRPLVGAMPSLAGPAQAGIPVSQAPTAFLPERPVAATPAMPGTARMFETPALVGEYIPSARQAAMPSVSAAAPVATRMEPLSWEEINRSGLQLPSITETMAGQEPARYRAGMSLMAPQAENRLLPSERRVFQAELGAMGVNPEDYYSERNRQARTGTPYRRLPTVRRRQKVGGFV